MLNVTFNKLPRSSGEDVGARDIWPRYTQRHHVLQLITEAISATRLIERRARPYPARKGLVWKPAVQQNIQRPVGSLDLYNSQHLVPLPCNIGKDLIKISVSIFSKNCLCVCSRCRLPKKEDDFRCACGAQFHLRLEGAARIEPCTHAIGQRCLRDQRKRLVHRAIAPQKFCPVAGPCGLLSIEVGKCHTLGKLFARWIARKNRPGFRVNLGDDKWRARRMALAENPLHIGRDRQLPRTT